MVGAADGGLAAGAAVLLHTTLPAFVSAAVAVGIAALMTGAMHLDALTDTLDATGAATRTEALARLGSFGVTGLTLDLLLKVGSIAFLLERGGAIAALVAAGALSRASALPLAAVLPYPRIEGGAGSVLSGRISPKSAATGVLLALVISGAVANLDVVWFAIAALGSTLMLWFVYRAWLGGATGDALGAATELCELVVLVVAAGLA